MSEAVTFSSEGLVLQGRLHKPGGNRGVVITHPHSLYGGSMDNPVVELLAASYARAGYATLRFNFRGVGKSEGAYGDGVGEGGDVAAAMAFLAAQGIERVSLAGYSFGAWVVAHMPAPAPPPEHILMVSPPVAFMKFSPDLSLPALALAVTGGEDEFAPPEHVEDFLQESAPDCELEVLPDADHFYWGQFRKLEDAVAAFLKTVAE
jgi:alpha/beta superfamily hydrolase